MSSNDCDSFKELVENTDDLVARINPGGCFQYVNPSSEKIFGIKPHLCVGRKALSFVYKDDCRSTLESFASWIANKTENASIENRIAITTGEVRHLMWSVHLDFDQSGALMGINTIGRDITQKNKMQRQLRRSAKMWNKLFMASPTWVTLATLDEGTMLDFNDAFSRDTGYCKEDAIGRTSIEMGLWPEPEKRDRALSLIKERGGVDKLPIILRMRNGELRDFLWSTVIITVRGQRCLLSVLVDVSNLKKN